jgi:hypothetical protein
MTEADRALGARYEIGSELNSNFRNSERGTRITTVRKELFPARTGVFTIGSCFAENVRNALNANGYAARPRYQDLDIDRATQMAGPLHHINYYTPFAIRQEVERVLDGLGPEPIHLPVAPGKWKVLVEGWEALWQDPLRHGVVAQTEEGILDVMAKIDALTRDALERAEAFVITLGLIESWVDTETGRHVWSSKVRNVSPEPDRFQFRLTDYTENYEAIRWVCQTIADRFPGKPVVITVSPVGLLATFSGRDIVVANSYSKSVLRAVAGAIEVEFPHVTYWPSYEFAMSTDVYQEDGRHVLPEGVEYIISSFLAAHAAVDGAGT